MPVLLLDSKNATEHVTVSAEVFRPGMHDDVCAPLEWILEGRRGKCGIHDEVCATGVGLLRIFFNVEGSAGWIDRRFEMDDVAGFELLGWAVERQLLKAGKALENLYHTVASMISFSDCNSLGIQQDQGGMERCQTRRITDCLTIQQGGKDGFESGRIRGRLAGVNIYIRVMVLNCQNLAAISSTESHTVRSTAGKSSSGLSEYRNVVERCSGGATSDTVFKA